MDSSVILWLCSVFEKEEWAADCGVLCCVQRGERERKGKKGKKEEKWSKQSSSLPKRHQNPVCKLQPKWAGETAVGICVDWQPIWAANLHKF